MSSLNLKNVEDEVVNFARSLVKDPRSRHTNTSESFSGNGVDKDFVLSNSAVCVNSVTVDSNSMKWGVDYTYDGNTKTVSFVSAPPSGTDNVVVDYDYGFSWGYWSYPSVSRKPDDYPVFGIVWLGGDSEVSDIGGNYLTSSPVFRLWVYCKDEDNMRASDTVKSVLDEFRNDFFSKTDWYLDGKGQGRIIPINVIDEPKPDTRRSGRVFGGFVDFEIPFIMEVKS